jgi:hypothetical protein
LSKCSACSGADVTGEVAKVLSHLSCCVSSIKTYPYQ